MKLWDISPTPHKMCPESYRGAAWNGRQPPSSGLLAWIWASKGCHAALERLSFAVPPMLGCATDALLLQAAEADSSEGESADGEDVASSADEQQVEGEEEEEDKAVRDKAAVLGRPAAAAVLRCKEREEARRRMERAARAEKAHKRPTPTDDQRLTRSARDSAPPSEACVGSSGRGSAGSGGGSAQERKPQLPTPRPREAAGRSVLSSGSGTLAGGGGDSRRARIKVGVPRGGGGVLQSHRRCCCALMRCHSFWVTKRSHSR